MSRTTTATIADARRLAHHAIGIGWMMGGGGTSDPPAHVARMLDGAAVLGPLFADAAQVPASIEDFPAGSRAALQRVAEYVRDDCDDLLADPRIEDSRASLAIHRDRAERVLRTLDAL